MDKAKALKYLPLSLKYNASFDGILEKRIFNAKQQGRSTLRIHRAAGKAFAAIPRGLRNNLKKGDQ